VAQLTARRRERPRAPGRGVAATSPGSTRGARSRRRGLSSFRGSDALLSVGSLVAGVLVWEIVGRTMDLIFLPPATDVVRRMLTLIMSGEVLPELSGSLQNLAMGYAIAAVAGVVIGVAMARVRWLERSLDPYVYAFLTAPTVVFVPIYFSLFGLSRWAIVALIVQYAVFIVVVNTITAVQTVDVELVEMARVYGARSEQVVVRKVLLRAALPLIAAGLRLGLGRAIKGMINGEILIAVVGLGGLSSAYGRAFDPEGVLAILLVVIVVALVLDRGAQALDDRVNAWLPKTYR
jgi:ABC-type nitrate/sulfonate/bicarbonate transport system permease component